jgi:predicted Zn-dependent peptidase
VSQTFIHPLATGMTLVAERMPHVRSASFNILVPAGAAYDPLDRQGLATLTCDLMTRGAGSRDSRQLSDALDNLGVDRSESAGTMNVQLSGSTLSRNLIPALEIYADILRRPHLPETELEFAQAMSLQEIQSVEDDPQRKVMLELRKHYYPQPLGRDNRGTTEGVEATTIDDVRRHFQTHFQPSEVILSIAGDFDWPTLRDAVEKQFGDWAGSARTPLQIDPFTPASDQIIKEIEQTQIALAMPSTLITDPDIYVVRGLVGVLSHDMSSRLFTNIREKYGLCYSVYASYEAFRDRGSIVGYIGARPELAQKALDLLLEEFRKLKEGIDEEELDRVKIGLKSGLIMRQESTVARAGALSADWYFLNRIRPLSEIQAALEGLTVTRLLEYLEQHPFERATVETLGPAPLTL